MPKLMIPGPVELEPDVLALMGQPVVAHYGANWVSVHNETLQLLQRVYQTAGDVYILPGSGSLSLDTAAQSAFNAGETVIVADNGWFGQRTYDILNAMGVRAVRLQTDPRQPINPDDIAAALDQHPDAVGVACVHLETSTGVLNPIRAIADVVRSHPRGENILFMVDAITGLGGADLQMDAWGIDLCCAASQKALGAPAGLAIVAVSPRAQAKIDARPENTARSWYLDLKMWAYYVEEWASWHPYPVTMPTSTVLALRQALRNLIAEGLDNRMARYERQARVLRDGLAKMGLELFVPESLMAPILTAVCCPDGMSAIEIRDRVLQDADILITTGFGAYRESVFRVGHMGGALNEGDINHLLNALQRIIPVQTQ